MIDSAVDCSLWRSRRSIAYKGRVARASVGGATWMTVFGVGIDYLTDGIMIGTGATIAGIVGRPQ